MAKLPETSQGEADLKATKKEDNTDDLLKLLKKTQSHVRSLENEIKKVETENIHQEQGFKDRTSIRFCSNFGSKIPVPDKELEELLLADPNSGVYFPVSCQEYADNGATQNGSYRVQPNANISRKYMSYPTYHN